MLHKKRTVTFEQKVTNASADTVVYITFMSYNISDKPTPINFQIFDQNNKKLLDKTKLNHHVVKLTPKKPQSYVFKLINPNNTDVKVLMGLDCKHCDKTRPDFMDKLDFGDKMIALGAIEKDLAQYHIYLIKAKSLFYT